MEKRRSEGLAAELAKVVEARGFYQRSELRKIFADVPCEEMEKVAEQEPSLAGFVYEVILSRERAGDTEEKENTSPEGVGLKEMAGLLLTTPKTPFSKWGADILKFTDLELPTAQKLCAVIRNSTLASDGDVHKIVHKLERICSSRSFSQREVCLGIILLEKVLLFRNVSPEMAFSIYSLMDSHGYVEKEELLAGYLEKLEEKEALGSMVSLFKKRGSAHEKILSLFVRRFPERAHDLFGQIEGDLRERIGGPGESEAISVLKDIFVYVDDDVETQMLGRICSNEEERERIKALCTERIWD
jgi:hypothetical protein